MSKSELTASDAALDARPNGSVYDFLYYDVRRVGSFLAQFDDAGHLQEVTATDAVAKSAGRGFSVNAGAGLPLIGEGSLGIEIAPKEGGSEALARVYDPLWANALTLLDYLSDRELIQRDITKARIGQFVLLSGALSVIDLAIMKEIWHLPSVKQLMRKGAAAGQDQSRQQRRAARGNPTNAEPSGIEFAMDIIPTLPHVVQAQIDSGDFSVWSSLRQDSLSVASSDILLKHGLAIPGEWNALGILDAVPDNDLLPQNHGLIGNLLANFSSEFSNAVRSTFGRPRGAYGITPLLIFRKVAAQ